MDKGKTDEKNKSENIKNRESKNKFSEIETTKNEGTNIKIQENEGTKFQENRGEIIMENEQEKKIETNKRIDFGQEYGSSITESMTYRQYLGDSAWVLDNFNPITRVLPLRESMPDDESKKLIDGVVKGDMPDFLTKCRAISTNCLDVGLEISNIAKILTQKRKGSIEKY